MSTKPPYAKLETADAGAAFVLESKGLSWSQSKNHLKSNEIT